MSVSSSGLLCAHVWCSLEFPNHKGAGSPWLIHTSDDVLNTFYWYVSIINYLSFKYQSILVTYIIYEIVHNTV